MILNNTPDNSPVLSNVGQVGEFRIRNSAKAFNILSSSLYANKIRAIIRELSCNAWDSHVAAGCADEPFEVHLPNSFEPWFSVRDYGVGLSHDQVVNIYTTYFESTKTASNEFIGALGLGSKSPFSYTENFSVTAIQAGRMGIYTAFINEQGVPSIALMTEAETAEPNGVEVKFSVNDRNDFHKFYQEATEVYRWFRQRPKITGTELAIRPLKYLKQDIVPGVHQLDAGHSYDPNSYAVMGNIAYPINVPNSDKNLGSLWPMLSCGLVIEFGIGELDFQASREGLSYIPQTIAAIRHRLETLNQSLGAILAQEADAIPNVWERVYFLRQRFQSKLWASAVRQYDADKKINYLDNHNDTFMIGVEQLRSRYNIEIRKFTRNYRMSWIAHKPNTWSVPGKPCWGFGLDDRLRFVISDIRTGILIRTKMHLRDHFGTVIVLEPADADQPMQLDEFFDQIQNPPQSQIIRASDMQAPERKVRQKTDREVTVLMLERQSTGSKWSSSYNNWVWRPAAVLKTLDTNATYYYVPLSGYEMISSRQLTDAKDLREKALACGLCAEFDGTLYGVRKADLDQVSQMPNWRNFEDYVSDCLTQADSAATLKIVRCRLPEILRWLDVMQGVRNIDAQSPAKKLKLKYQTVQEVTYNEHQHLALLNQFKIPADATNQTFAKVQTELKQVRQVLARYPLLTTLATSASREAVAEYINLIDQHKGY